jgi:hypothetical protein
MSIIKRHLAESEERMVLVEELCIDAGALILDPDTEEVYFSADEAAYKKAYVTVFQAWANGTVKGEAPSRYSKPRNLFLRTSRKRTGDRDSLAPTGMGDGGCAATTIERESCSATLTWKHGYGVIIR